MSKKRNLKTDKPTDEIGAARAWLAAIAAGTRASSDDDKPPPSPPGLPRRRKRPLPAVKSKAA